MNAHTNVAVCYQTRISFLSCKTINNDHERFIFLWFGGVGARGYPKGQMAGQAAHPARGNDTCAF